MTALLEVKGLAVSYGAVPAVDGVSLEILPGELRVILGANGAGKTTIIKTLFGLLRPRAGEIRFDGEIDLLRLKPHQIHLLGVAWVPEGRQLWNTLTVMDNLRLGGFAVARQGPASSGASRKCSSASRDCGSATTRSPARSAAGSSKWLRSRARSSRRRSSC